MDELKGQIREKLWEVRDPEFGKSIMERELVDEVEIEGDIVRVRYHLTVPFCPQPFAMHIGRQIREKVSQVPGVRRAEVIVQDHLHTDEINAALAEEA
jgi:ATP-binding protein involved in chromosome partitioning